MKKKGPTKDVVHRKIMNLDPHPSNGSTYKTVTYTLECEHSFKEEYDSKNYKLLRRRCELCPPERR